MAEQITKWRDKMGHLHDTEVEALRSDVKFLEARVSDLQRSLRIYQRQDEPTSSYGSSGGGGHD